MYRGAQQLEALALPVPQHGPGKKHDRTIALEPWQGAIVEAHTKEFVRGLVHSDGSRVVNRVKRKPPGEGFYEYPRYHFTNVSTDIIRLYTEALDRLEIPQKAHSSERKENRRDKHVVSVSRREAVARMDEFVGPEY